MADDLRAPVEVAIQARDDGDKVAGCSLLTVAAAIAQPAGRL